MTAEGAPRVNRLLIRKSVDQVQREAAGQHLKRTLGAVNLVFLGIGCIIGAGIYVITGNAAAEFAGPAVLLSFVVAGLACVFAGLCYAELASAMPVSGSAYTYSYATLGEVFAWIMGWLLVLEYGVSAAVVAAGWSGYVVSLLGEFHLVIPLQFTSPLIQSVTTDHGLVFSVTRNLNLVGAAGILGVAALLVRGVSESAAVNNVIVCVKVGILVLFVAVGVFFVHPHNWTPFIPASEGGFTYGVKGIFRAASVIFFAYVGFEAVSTAAGEAKNPQRDMPIGILGSLFVCTILYMAVAAVLTGAVPFRQLGVAAPLALAADTMHLAWFSFLIKLGAVAGLTSVMLVLTYGQSRVFYAMARDGLLPTAFSRLHATFRTPWIGTIVLGGLIALTAALLPITILNDLVSLGTAFAFGIVCLSVMYLRTARPTMTRPFNVPLGGALAPRWAVAVGATAIALILLAVFTLLFNSKWTAWGAAITVAAGLAWLAVTWKARSDRIWIGPVPILGIVGAVFMAEPLIEDIIESALRGDRIPATILVCYIVLGAAIYLIYGLSHSRLAKGLDVLDDGFLPTPMAAAVHGIQEN